MKSVSNDKISFYFDKASAPAEWIKSGEEITFHCQDCYCGQVLRDGFPFAQMDMARNNPVTGPVYVEGAEPGDVLRIKIKRLEIASSGSTCARKGAGIYDIEGSHCNRFLIEDGMVRFTEDISFPVRPMIGIVGTAPAGERVSTQPPGPHGGNMDIKDLGEGATLYLPVEVPGALLSTGDFHAVQGDGETVICALEMSGSATFEVTVLKGRKDIPTPFLVAEGKYITTAAAESLDACSREAARKMHRFLIGHTSLSDLQCGLLLSMQGNLRISQVVNPLQGCVMEFPVGLANETFEG